MYTTVASYFATWITIFFSKQERNHVKPCAIILALHICLICKRPHEILCSGVHHFFFRRKKVLYVYLSLQRQEREKAWPLWLLSQVSMEAKQLAQHKGCHYNTQQTSIVSLLPAVLTSFLMVHSNCDLENKQLPCHIDRTMFGVSRCCLCSWGPNQPLSPGWWEPLSCFLWLK